MSHPLLRAGALLGVATLTLAACMSDALAPAPTPLTPVTIQASASNTAIAGIAVEISASDISPALLVNLALVEATGQWSGTIEVPVGNGRTFTGRAFDAQGNVTHQGSVQTNVIAGTNSPIGLVLNPIGGGGPTGTVPIEVTLVNRALSVTPTVAGVAVGAEVDFAATLSGSACEPTWAVSNPGRALLTSVSQDGLQVTVRGRAAGEVSVVVNCGGVAAAATLTVQ